MAVPTVSSFAPSTVTANGAQTVITGLNFNTPAVSAVTVNGTPATFVVTNDTTLTVQVPQSATGLATVVITNASGSVTNTTGLTITAFVVSPGSSVFNWVGTFDTSGTAKLSLDQQYTGLSSFYQPTSLQGKYRTYLEKTAKIAAVTLYNARYNPDLTVPTY